MRVFRIPPSSFPLTPSLAIRCMSQTCADGRAQGPEQRANAHSLLQGRGERVSPRRNGNEKKSFRQVPSPKSGRIWRGRLFACVCHSLSSSPKCRYLCLGCRPHRHMHTHGMHVSPKEKKLTQRILNEFKKTGISIGIISFLIARAGIMDNMTPFGISFLISYLLKDVSIIIPIVLSAGILTVHGLNGYMYVVSIFAIYIIYNKFLKNKKGVSVAKVSLLFSGIFLGFRILNLIILGNYYIYDFFLVMFESLVVFTLSYVFSYSIPVKKTKNTKGEKTCLETAGCDVFFWQPS